MRLHREEVTAFKYLLAEGFNFYVIFTSPNFLIGIFPIFLNGDNLIIVALKFSIEDRGRESSIRKINRISGAVIYRADNWESVIVPRYLERRCRFLVSKPRETRVVCFYQRVFPLFQDGIPIMRIRMRSREFSNARFPEGIWCIRNIYCGRQIRASRYE